MKRVFIAKILLLVVVAHLVFSCENSAPEPALDLLNSLTNRLDQKDYVTAIQFGNSNPHELMGKRMEDVYHNLFNYRLAERNGFFYGNSFVVGDKKRQMVLKEITRAELEKGGFEYSEKYIDEFTERIKGYKFTSEDMTRYFQDAEDVNAISSIEHQIIILQLRALSKSKANSRAQDIIRTVEFEVLKSGIETSSKDKILAVNAIARNLINDPRISMNGSFPNLFSDPFQQTTPVVVGTVLVLFAVAALATAWFDQNCNNTCQTNMYVNAMGYAAAGMLICEGMASNAPCPDNCDYSSGCFRNSTGFCVCR